MPRNGSDAGNDSTTLAASDPSHPYYIHPSDHIGMSLTAVPFDGTGFGTWQKNMLRALSAKNKIGFVDGSLPKPEENTPLFRAWKRCDDMVTTWILNGLSRDIGGSLVYSNTAGETWKELQERFGQSDGVRLFQLEQEISAISQGTSDIATYFTKLKGSWDELDAISVTPSCTCSNCKCEISKKLSIKEQQRKLLKFLMGLNEDYKGLRGNILVMNPLPTISQAYSLLLQEERQREVQPRSLNLQESAVSFQSFRDAQSSIKDSQSSRGNMDNKRSNLFCNYCKKPGHVIEKCYKLHGYPPNHKFGKGKRLAAAVPGAMQDIFEEITEESNEQSFSPSLSPIPGFTHDQYKQLMSFLSNMGIQQSNNSQVHSAISNFSENQLPWPLSPQCQKAYFQQFKEQIEEWCSEKRARG